MRQKKISKDSFEFVLCCPTAAGYGTCLKVDVSPVRFLGETDFSFSSGCQSEIVSVGDESSCLLPHLRAGSYLLDVCTPMHTASDLLSLYFVGPVGSRRHFSWYHPSSLVPRISVPPLPQSSLRDLSPEVGFDGDIRIRTLIPSRSLILCTLSSYGSLY